eukprot:Gb_16481 [translate_table: standard]
MDLRALPNMLPTGAFTSNSCGLLPLQKQMVSAKVSTFSSQIQKKKKMPPNMVKASSADYGFGAGSPNIVDANMTILRKRMNEIKMQERNYKAPQEWMEWERKVYPAYHSSICHAIGLLQNYLMNVRPSFAVVTLSLMSLGLAASVSLVFTISGIHLSTVLNSTEFFHNLHT